MSVFNSEKSRPSDIYTSDPSPSQAAGVYKEPPWRSFGTSMDAISFGFVATAVFISMFLIMAIFEHLFKPSPQFSSPQPVILNASESQSITKQGNQQRKKLVLYFIIVFQWMFTIKVPSCASEYSVLMPGQVYPTYIAQPAPLPCAREKIYWPPHKHNFVH